MTAGDRSVLVEEQRQGLDAEGRELYDERLVTFEERLASADENGAEPEQVAAKIASALEGGGSRYPVGRGARTAATLRPLLFDSAFDRLVGGRLG
jgi:hypothetical protein